MALPKASVTSPVFLSGVLLVLVVGALAAYHRQHASTADSVAIATPAPTASTSPADASTPTPASTSTPSPTAAANVTAYTDPANGLSFSYANRWGSLARSDVRSSLDLDEPAYIQYLFSAFPGYQADSGKIQLIKKADFAKLSQDELAARAGKEWYAPESAYLQAVYANRSLAGLTTPAHGYFFGSDAVSLSPVKYVETPDGAFRGVTFFIHDTQGLTAYPLVYTAVMENKAGDVLAATFSLDSDQQKAIEKQYRDQANAGGSVAAITAPFEELLSNAYSTFGTLVQETAQWIASVSQK